MSGYVYLLKCQDFYKIGIATDVHKRISSMQTGSPHPITLVASVEVDNPLSLEKELHAMYSHRHHRREWFALTEEDVDAIKSLFYGSAVVVDGPTVDGNATLQDAFKTPGVTRAIFYLVLVLVIFGAMLMLSGESLLMVLPVVSSTGIVFLVFGAVAMRSGILRHEDF